MIPRHGCESLRECSLGLSRRHLDHVSSTGAHTLARLRREVFGQAYFDRGQAIISAA